MASPQTENGYTKIANEILEQLFLAGINGCEYRILLVVIRKTYGFQKKRDRISISQFQNLTKMNRPQAINTIKSLLEKKILKKENNQFIFNKNYEEWVVGKRGSMQKDTTETGSMQLHTGGSMQKHTKTSMQKHTHKRKKEIETKEKGFDVLGAEIIKAFIEIDPKNKNYYKNTTQRKACNFLLQEYGLDEVLRRIKLLPQLNKLPYFPTVYTPYELQEKWKKLEEAVEREQVKLKAKERQVIL